MTSAVAKIRERVDVSSHPTVVRLSDLDSPDAGWLSERFVLTPEIERHLRALRQLLSSARGSGVFLIGAYGCGKSHLLAYITQQLHAGALLSEAPSATTVSLVNFSAENRLEDIVSEALGVPVTRGDRRAAWQALAASRPEGSLLILDELSEFLRSKRDPRGFNEDVRFLQFLGEWAQDQRFWILAAMQESIEHTGELEYSLYRKIKDRYPLRLLLTPAHVQTLIADGILIKKAGYEIGVERLAAELRNALPGTAIDYDVLASIYPLHPATLALLDEVRDRFSQARGVVDFVVTQLRGDRTRGVAAFLDQPWGQLVTPDAIIDHFRDLLELQPEFLPLAQQVFPWYQKNLDSLFDRAALRALAEKILRLLVLVYLSPAREHLSSAEALEWLLFSAARVDPERNLKVVQRVLATLAGEGRYVSERNGTYRLDLKDDGAALENRLQREMGELRGRDELVLETVVALLPADGFNPFRLPREQWQHRRTQWHFHERRYAVWFGENDPTPTEHLALCVRLPWGEARPVAGACTLMPAAIDVGEDMVELAALANLRERPLAPEAAKRLRKRIDTRIPAVEKALRNAWLEASIMTPEGRREPPPRLADKATLDAWLDAIAIWSLRRMFPAFERFAPGHGPLPKEAWREFMRLALDDDIGRYDASDYVKLIREAYLAPMGLLRRRGREYTPPPNLERNELVALLGPLLEHGPTPGTVYEHLANPIYGLVPDQVTALLLMLLLQGEIDILKERKSYRDSFETLPNPLSYDRIVTGHALAPEPLKSLEQLCDGLGVRGPKRWTVLAQRRSAAQMREIGRQRIALLEPLIARLGEALEGRTLAARVERHVSVWKSLDKGDGPLQGLEQFLYEIGSSSAFLLEVAEFDGLAERVRRQLDEIQRYRHLLRHPSLEDGRDAGLNDAVAALGEMPGLEHKDALDDWLKRIDRVYAEYKRDYRERHDRWWREYTEHQAWSWQPPAVAVSRHLGIADSLRALENARRESQRLRCRGIVDLNFQPVCSCGFDGKEAPVVSHLQRFEATRADIEHQLRLFFQQDAVKARMHDWQRQGFETSVQTLAYLEGKRALPEVREIDLLDKHLGGLELVREVDQSLVTELLRQRVWEPAELRAALAEFLGRLDDGRRVRFVGGEVETFPQALAAWCAEQTLRHGIALPSGLGRDALAAVGKSIRPEWVGSEALARLDQLGLDDTTVDSILTWLQEGQVSMRDGSDLGSGPVAALSQLSGASMPASPDELAAASEQLYRHHHRLRRIAGPQWLARLEAIANAEIGELPRLPELLSRQLQAQWLLLDCLGLPLIRPLQPLFEELFGAWEPPHLVFSSVTEETTTDACYRDMLEAGIAHGFHKLNAVDELVHGDFMPFDDLAARVVTELRIGAGRLKAQLDPAQPLVVFADHGFRLDASGNAYCHGGPSTLERVVPVWQFAVRGGSDRR